MTDRLPTPEESCDASPMTRVKSLTILFLAGALALAGCKKKEDAASTVGSATKPTDTAAVTPPAAAPATPPAADPATPAAPAGPVGSIKSDEDYIAKSTAALEKMTEIFKSAGTNCDKLADDITKFTAENQSFLKDGQAYGKAHPEAEKKFDETTKEKMTAFATASEPTMNACQGNKKLMEAMTKMAGE